MIRQNHKCGRTSENNTYRKQKNEYRRLNKSDILVRYALLVFYFLYNARYMTEHYAIVVHDLYKNHRVTGAPPHTIVRWCYRYYGMPPPYGNTPTVRHPFQRKFFRSTTDFCCGVYRLRYRHQSERARTYSVISVLFQYQYHIDLTSDRNRCINYFFRHIGTRQGQVSWVSLVFRK